MTDDPTPPRPSTAKAFHDGLSSLSHDSAAPPPATLAEAVAQDPAGIHLELHKEGVRNDRRFAYLVDEVVNALQTWMDDTMRALMPPDVYAGTDDLRREWCDREGFHLVYEPTDPTGKTGPVALGVYVLRHGTHTVSTFALKGARASKLEVPR